MNQFLRKDVIAHLDDRTVYGEDKQHLFYLDDENYYITEWVGSGNHAEDLNYPVVYKINQDGFRSNHFKTINKNKISILFGGCSWTFGEGVPEEYTWTNMLSNKISNYLNKDVETFNTGYMGSSIDLIIKNTMAFIRKYGKPDYVFLLLPDTARKIRFNTKTGKYFKAFPHIQWIDEKLMNAQKKYTLEFQFENNILDVLNLLYLFEDYCEQAGIKLLWTSWYRNDKVIYMENNFKYYIDQDDVDKSFIDKNNISRNFIDSSSIDSKNEYYPNPNNLPYWQIAKDNCHPGTAWTHFITEVFFKKGESRGYFKNN